MYDKGHQASKHLFWALEKIEKKELMINELQAIDFGVFLNNLLFLEVQVNFHEKGIKWHEIAH